MQTIPTYIINLKKRPERKANVLREFEGRPEFDVAVVEAIEHTRGALGLWQTIQQIVRDKTDAFILICEDDHLFTEHYSKEALFAAIDEAERLHADVLCGGVSWFEDALPESEQLFSVREFTGLQFTIVFRRFFEALMNADLGEKDAADSKISQLAEIKLVTHPFLSVQKDYGYSDATPFNNEIGGIEDFFVKCDEHFQSLRKVHQVYQTRIPNVDNDFEDVQLPVYVSGGGEPFVGRNEFAVTILSSSGWPLIREAVQLATVRDEDVIVIAGNRHEFTEAYSKEYLFRNIVEAHEQETDVLLGEVSNFLHAIPVGATRFWVHPFGSVQFMILYRRIFPFILDEPYYEGYSVEEMLSRMTSNKMVIHPFISGKKSSWSERLSAIRSRVSTP